MAENNMVRDILENASVWTAFIRSFSGTSEEPGDKAYALHVRGGLEAYVALCNQLVDSFRTLWREVFDGQIKDYNASGNMAISACRVTLQAGEELRKKLWEASKRGIPEDLTATFDAAVKGFEDANKHVTELLGQVNSRWPWVNPVAYAEGAAAGRSRPAKEVFDELRHRVS